MNIYRKIWIKNFGKIPVDDDGKSYEIHHIDGNRNNNNLDNLKCISIQEHYNIHQSQGDWGACSKILKRMKLTKEESFKINSELAKKMWQNEDYKKFHSDLLKNKWATDKEYVKKMKLATTKWNKEQLANGTHPFINPIYKKKCNERRDEVINQLVLEGKHNFQTKEMATKSTERTLKRNAIVHSCPNCHKVGKGPVMKRHHFDNCKLLVVDSTNGHLKEI
jgi:hypothetical protein